MTFTHKLISRFLLLAAVSSLSAATLPTASALGLNAGDQYAFVFVSSTLTAATSSSIATYNTFVQGLANTAGIGNTVGRTWKAVVSTGSSSPNTTDTNAPAGASVNVFRIDGVRVALVGRFYSPNVSPREDHLAAINISELGTGITGTDRVWTGAADGAGGASGSGLLGSGTPVFGHANGTRGERGFTDSWAREGNAANNNQYRLYALSDVLTAPSSNVPEPSTFALIALGLAAAGWRRRRV